MSYHHISSYAVELRNDYALLKELQSVYDSAVSYLLSPVLNEWESIKDIDSSDARMSVMETIVHTTKSHTARYDFDEKFYKMPSYLRRSAILKAVGIVSCYKSNLNNGTNAALSYKHHNCPALYKDNVFKWKDDYTVSIKVYKKNDWVWHDFRLRNTDADYLKMRMTVNNRCKIFAPVLEKKYGKYFLRFALEEMIDFPDVSIFERKACCVDMGLLNDAVCSVMDVHGTVLGRHFINCAREKDSVRNALHRVSVFQRLHGGHDVRHLWNVAVRRNENLANKAAHEIVAYARETGCHVIVFEYLDTKGKKRGSRRQRLHHWKHRAIQKKVESLAHKYGIRISRVCTYNTSKLAYDGSGEVKRGRKVSDDTPYDICCFQSGKYYNCDLNASYNIGARYFIRELINALPGIKAEVPDIGGGTRRVLADLWRINAAVCL